MTTNNGMRALGSCAHAGTVLVGSFLNLQATADFVGRTGPEPLLLVCSGTAEQASYEDILGAGAFCELLGVDAAPAEITDSARMARELFRKAAKDLPAAASQSRNGRRLGAIPGLPHDVP